MFLIFLLISTLLWFLAQLDEVYVTSISYPVEYRDMPQDKLVVGDLPSQIELEIKGEGFKLLEYQFSNALNPLLLHVNAYNLQTAEDGDSPRYYIVTQSAATRISQQLSQSIEILDITPDTLFFEFAKKVSRSLPIRPNISYSFEKQMMLRDEIKIEPDSVVVSGPNSVLDTVEYIPTKRKSFGNLESTLQTRIGLQKSHDQLELSTRKVNLTIPVERYTEGELQKEIQVINQPDSVVVRTFPRTVTITYLVGLSRYEQVIPELFKAVVDYRDIKEDREKLKVRIENAPGYLKSYTYNPREVEYIIERKP
jgi:hypothetical protein